MIKKTISLLVIFISLLFGNDQPADSLLSDNDINVLKKISIIPIKLWQKISYNTPALNCQFEPSCSQFTAMSIAKYGVIKGSILGADRIIRCNPSAYHYHTNIDSGGFHTDGRLLDPVPDKIDLHLPDLATYSSIVPGLGRVLDGKITDGVFSFLLVSSSAYASYQFYQKDKKTGSIIFGLSASIFWISDFYYTLRKK